MKGVTLPTETVFVMEASPIKFGLGATDEIAYDARRLGLKRVLIVTDRRIGELGLPDRVRVLLEEEGVKADIYDGVEIEPNTRLAEMLGERTTVMSHHHQGLRTLAPGLVETARADDGVLEAVEAPERRFTVGVLWHPEAGEDARLFETLVAEAARYRDEK